ncbi:MAG: ATP-dependent DNA helicase RecG [Pseudoxanthomonas suwonensis]|nr:MAG: ATP-dependent DNA helicase RecG [Pseudoxanthomonas suwonensis]
MNRRDTVAAVDARQIGTAVIATLPGVAKATAERFAARGLRTLQDLWFLLPRDYEDRTRIAVIRDLQPGVAAQVEGRVEAVDTGFRYRPMLRVAVTDASGGTLLLRFFNFRKPQVAQFQPGTRIRAYGTPRPGAHGLEIVHPKYSVLDAATAPALSEHLQPVYPAIEGIAPASLRRLIGLALDRLPDDRTLELLPDAMLRGLQLPDLRQALLLLHRPSPAADLAALREGRHPAQRRLALEELLAHQLSLRRQRLALAHRPAVAITAHALADRLQAALPFALTDAQRRVLAEIRTDLARPKPMLRLVQGDVGSGKTIVAALAALQAVEQGHQVALVAPTELLAEQHRDSFDQWLRPLRVDVAWLAGKVTGQARTRTLQAVADGTAPVVIGTHAVMQDTVRFRDLALVIVDEQHRFGVHQRLALREKGSDATATGRVPHQLVMTATPIPRTLAMSAYADLDVSSIDALPPGRTPVQTVVLSSERRAELIERIRVACRARAQAYWVCTLIDEPDAAAGKAGHRLKIEAQAAQTAFEQLSAALPELRIALVHGRLKPAEKQAAMAAFKDGTIDLLVATTVIEVGVDVPNASLMIIENAERLGLAQLHQLRGRVGRGSAQSTCVLLYQPPLSALARQRLQTLRDSNDGFLIAETDLALRGPGELLGTRQTGLVGFRIADLARDADLLPQVRTLADALLERAPDAVAALIARWVGSAERYASA